MSPSDGITRMNVPGPRAQALIARDESVVSQAYGRPYPFAMSRGQGARVFDVDGNRFLDFVAGIAVNATGHCHPRVVAALREQAEKFLHVSSDYYHEQWVLLAEKLNQLRPFIEPARVFMVNSGTEAVEAALKLARHHTGRDKFIGFLGAFHGRSTGALSFTASKTTQREGFGMMPGVTHIPYPDPFRPLLAAQPGDADCGEAVMRYLEEVIFRRLLSPQQVAAVLVEPIQGEGGYIVPPESFFARLRALCDRHGILLIADEVQSGMGRTGKWWAIEHWGVEPDIVCSAKGIASGLPLGAMIAREHISTWPAGSHGNTFGGNPLGCAAALATIAVLQDGALQNAREQGVFLQDALAEIAGRHAAIGDVRGKGLMIGIDLVRERDSRVPAKALAERVAQLAFIHGLLLLPAGESVVRMAPPLVLTRAEAEEGLAIFEHALTLAEAR